MAKFNKTLKIFAAWQWLKREGAVVWRALIDRETPTKARLAALALILYVVSPIDLVPDFIPFLGWVDDLVIIPLGMAFVRLLVPPHVWVRAGGKPAERRRRMRSVMKDVTPRNFGM